MPTHFTNGVSNVTQGHPLYEFGLPDPTKWVSYFNDFNTYTAGDWTITTVEAGAGDATEALTDVAGGALLITNDAADDDSDFFNLVGESFQYSATKKMFFRARFKISDATQSDFVMGLQITDTTPLAVTDGVYFTKADASTSTSFVVVKDSTATTETGVATIADDTFVTLAFFYNPQSGKFEVYADDSKVAEVVNTNAPDDELLTVSFGLQNGEAVAKTMTLDYVFAAVER
jgi:hypothetical protein